MAGNELTAEMKKLVAAIALLCLSSTVLAHDIYSNLRDRDGRFCCNGQDCRPVQVIVLPNGSYYLPRTNEIIPADRGTPSTDDRFPHCTYSAVADVVWVFSYCRAHPSDRLAEAALELLNAFRRDSTTRR